ncbi:hypothetical protein AURDEDRAFT_122678 [Auricularia subglabra TFB-10046 SS5]|nr:hypothetical protein AURDEDRAFT_122678 [Auricularia subglabra TFB-10046 SS5]
MHLTITALVVLLASCGVVQAFNVTVDDAFGDERTNIVPRYSHGWKSHSHTQLCSQCGARPNEVQAYRGTWHDASTYVTDEPSTISIDFSGTKIYVFFILFNAIGTANNNTRLSFYMDGSDIPEGYFLHTTNAASDLYMYNQLVFESNTETMGNHTLLVSSWSDGRTGSLALFDYAIYTSTEESAISGITASPTPILPARVPGKNRDAGGASVIIGPAVAGGLVAVTTTKESGTLTPAPGSTTSPTSTPPAPIPGKNRDPGGVSVIIGGAVAGGLVAMFLLAALLWWCLLRRRGLHAFSSAAPASQSSCENVLRPFDGHLQHGPECTLEARKGYFRDSDIKISPICPGVLDLELDSDRTQLPGDIGQGMREELEQLRQMAEPPKYEHCGR